MNPIAKQKLVEIKTNCL